MKVGRNERCPCGSGQKFKRCCGPNRGSRVVLEAVSLAAAFLPDIKAHRAEIRAAMRIEIQRAISECRDSAIWRDAAFDTERMEHQIVVVRERFAALVAKTRRDRQYWYLVVRALAHEYLDLINSVQTGSHTNEYLPDLLWAITELTFSCEVPSIPIGWVEDREAKGMLLAPSKDAVMMAGRLAALAHLYFSAEGAYRYAGKGMPIRALEGDSTADDDLVETSVRSFEQRKQQFLTITGDAGFWYDAGAFFPSIPDVARLWGASHAKPGYAITVDSIQPKETISGPYFPLPLTEPRHLSNVDFEQHPSLLPWDPWKRGTCTAMLPYDALLNRFATSFEAALGISAARLTSFLYALGLFIGNCIGFSRLDTSRDTPRFLWPDEMDSKWRRAHLHFWKEATQLALLRSSREQWLRGLAQAMQEVAASHPEVLHLSGEDLAQLVDRFTFRGPASRRRTDDPHLFWALSSKTLIFDFFADERFLHDLFASIQAVEIKPTTRMERRGAFFEDQVRSFFIRELQLDSRRTVAGVRTGQREIDLAFVTNRVLFVIECKARVKDAADIAGHFKKVRARHTQFRQELELNLPQRIEAIRAGLVSNAIAPTDFDRAIALVCTATVEYLPMNDPIFWCDALPVVGSPEELLSTIRRVTGYPATRGS